MSKHEYYTWNRRLQRYCYSLEHSLGNANCLASWQWKSTFYVLESRWALLWPAPGSGQWSFLETVFLSASLWPGSIYVGWKKSKEMSINQHKKNIAIAFDSTKFEMTADSSVMPLIWGASGASITSTFSEDEDASARFIILVRSKWDQNLKKCFLVYRWWSSF